MAADTGAVRPTVRLHLIEAVLPIAPGVQYGQAPAVRAGLRPGQEASMYITITEDMEGRIIVVRIQENTEGVTRQSDF